MTAPSDQAPILIIEDDKKTASLIALYLEREGFRTLVAYDGETVLVSFVLIGIFPITAKKLVFFYRSRRGRAGSR